MSPNPRAAELDDDLAELIRDIADAGDVTTLSVKRTNRIAGVDRSGVYVETDRSDSRGSGPQLVPAWMIVVAWEHLKEHGELSQEHLLNGLNVKRSAFVCALLAKFPEVRVRSTRPIVLELNQRPHHRDVHEGSDLTR